MMLTALTAAPLLLASSLVEQGQLETRLAEPSLYEAQSGKPISELEFCVARSLSAAGAFPLGPFRDGKDRAVIFGSRLAEVKVYLLVIMTETAQGTRLEVKGRNADALAIFRPSLEACK